MKFKILTFFLFLIPVIMAVFLVLAATGCAPGYGPLTRPQLETGATGIVTGAVAGKFVQSVKEALTPEYVLYVPSIEVCAQIPVNEKTLLGCLQESSDSEDKDECFFNAKIKCVLSPCSKDTDEECEVTFNLLSFVENEQYQRIALTTQRQTAMLAHCGKEKIKCVEALGEYEGVKVLLTTEK